MSRESEWRDIGEIRMISMKGMMVLITVVTSRISVRFTEGYDRNNDHNYKEDHE